MNYWTAGSLVFLLFCFDVKAEVPHERDELGAAHRHDFRYDEGSAALNSNTEEIEDAPVVAVTAEGSTPEGGGTLRLDPTAGIPKEPQLSWWERFYKWAGSFF